MGGMSLFAMEQDALKRSVVMAPQRRRKTVPAGVSQAWIS